MLLSFCFAALLQTEAQRQFLNKVLLTLITGGAIKSPNDIYTAALPLSEQTHWHTLLSHLRHYLVIQGRILFFSRNVLILLISKHSASCSKGPFALKHPTALMKC